MVGEVDTARAAKLLKDVPLFASCKGAELKALAESMSAVQLGAGSWLFQRGDAGTCMYLLDRGEVAVVLPSKQSRSSVLDDELAADRVFTRLQPGSVVGELALFYNQPRTASVRAEQETVLLSLEKAVFERFAASRPQVHQAMLVQALSCVSFLRGKPLPVLRAVARCVKSEPMERSTHVVREGTEGDAMYIVVSGTLLAYTRARRNSAIFRESFTAVGDGDSSSDAGSDAGSEAAPDMKQRSSLGSPSPLGAPLRTDFSAAGEGAPSLLARARRLLCCGAPSGDDPPGGEPLAPGSRHRRVSYDDGERPADEEVQRTLVPGDVFGEEVLLKLGTRHDLSVVCDADVQLYSLSKGDFESLQEEHPALRSAVLAEVLGRAELFEGVLRTRTGREELAKLIDKLAVRDLASRERVFTEGEEADGMYVVVGGRIVVFREAGGGDDGSRAAVRRREVLTSITAGCFLGEQGLINNTPRSASAEAVGPARVFHIPRALFEELCESGVVDRAAAQHAGLRQGLRYAQQLTVQGAGEVPSTLPFKTEMHVAPGFDPDPVEENRLAKECQDVGVVRKTFMGPDQALVAVFDGHGRNGRTAASYVARRVPELVQEGAGAADPSQEVLKAAFESAEADLVREAKEKGYTVGRSGATGTVLLLRRGEVECAWVGDSRAVLCRRRRLLGRTEDHALSVDHKPDDAAELARIRSMGGQVLQIDTATGEKDPDLPHRVYYADNYKRGPGIAMARSIGDTDATAIGCIPTPSHRSHALAKGDMFAVVASDGLWDVFTSSEVCRWVLRYVTRHRAGLLDGTAKPPSRAIAEEAQRRWVERDNAMCIVDDTTVIIVWFVDPLKIMG